MGGASKGCAQEGEGVTDTFLNCYFWSWKSGRVATNGTFLFSLDFLAKGLFTVGVSVGRRPRVAWFFWPLALVGH